MRHLAVTTSISMKDTCGCTVHCGTLTTTFTTSLHRLAASMKGHRQQEHRRQNNSPRRLASLNLLVTLKPWATSLTAYRATQLRLILTAQDRMQLSLLCTFARRSCQVSNQRRCSDKHSEVGVWISCFYKVPEIKSKPKRNREIHEQQC